MNVSRYLDRIGYQDTTTPTRESLDRLIACHQETVPFENIDIVRLRRPIVLDEERLFAKIVGERRGGFCYELNGLFAGLLEALGYGVTRGYAVWPIHDGEWTVPYEHIVLGVTLPDSGERVLVDVGFGTECPVVAVPLSDGEIRPVDHRAVEAYRASAIPGQPETWRIEVKRPDTDWALVYEADLTPRRLEAYARRCDHLQTSPDSPFTRNLICSRPLENGRVTLGGGNFIMTIDDERTERPLEGVDDELDLLRTWFAIEIEPERYGATR
jgi:N-hydroxyarylamine O-acetyltransferase